MAKDSPSQIQPKVQIRMEESLRQQLMDAAYKADRSLNAEIVARLEKSFGEEAHDIGAIGSMVDDHEQQLKELWIHIETLQAAVSLTLGEVRGVSADEVWGQVEEQSAAPAASKKAPKDLFSMMAKRFGGDGSPGIKGHEANEAPNTPPSLKGLKR